MATASGSGRRARSPYYLAGTTGRYTLREYRRTVSIDELWTIITT
jgi:hypothetical protein